jgi:hypothetical protein
MTWTTALIVILVYYLNAINESIKAGPQPPRAYQQFHWAERRRQADEEEQAMRDGTWRQSLNPPRTGLSPRARERLFYIVFIGVGVTVLSVLQSWGLIHG